MMGVTHFAAGALASAAMVPATSEVLHLGLTPGEFAVGVVIGAIAGLLPDIDHPDSLLTQGKLPGGHIFGELGRFASWLLCWPPRIVGVGARGKMNHRGGTHSVTFMFGWVVLAAPVYALMFGVLAFALSALLQVIGAALGFHNPVNPGAFAHWLWDNLGSIAPLVMASVFWGYFAHLVTDSMTNVPIPWPWPFSKRRLFLLPRGMRVTTGQTVETIFVRPLVIILAVTVFVINIGISFGHEILQRGQKLAPHQPVISHLISHIPH